MPLGFFDKFLWDRAAVAQPPIVNSVLPTAQVGEATRPKQLLTHTW